MVFFSQKVEWCMSSFKKLTRFLLCSRISYCIPLIFIKQISSFVNTRVCIIEIFGITIISVMSPDINFTSDNSINQCHFWAYFSPRRLRTFGAFRFTEMYASLSSNDNVTYHGRLSKKRSISVERCPEITHYLRFLAFSTLDAWVLHFSASIHSLSTLFIRKYSFNGSSWRVAKEIFSQVY